MNVPQQLAAEAFLCLPYSTITSASLAPWLTSEFEHSIHSGWSSVGSARTRGPCEGSRDLPCNLVSLIHLLHCYCCLSSCRAVFRSIFPHHTTSTSATWIEDSVPRGARTAIDYTVTDLVPTSLGLITNDTCRQSKALGALFAFHVAALCDFQMLVSEFGPPHYILCFRMAAECRPPEPC
jgi:hypothetical protein